MTSRRPRVAIAHDYITQRGGAERVVLAMARAFPDAKIHTTLYEPEGTYQEFQELRIVTSPLNRVPFFRQHHRTALPVLPLASRAHRVDADVVIASTSGWAHGFGRPADSQMLVYCHAPARWLYQSETYLGGPLLHSPRGIALAAIRPSLIRWDRAAAARADRYLANSRVVRERIREAYAIDAEVVPPPFGIDPSASQEPVDEVAPWAAAGGYHLLVSRLLPYKNVHHAVEAFRGMPERLVVVGHGPMAETLRAALSENVRLVSGLSDAQLRYTYAHATALVAPSHEDFGLTPIEAAAYGRPTLALRAGGYLDTVTEGLNGVFFTEPTASAIREAVTRTRGTAWDEGAIRAHADRFSEARFAAALHAMVDELLDSATGGR